MEKTAYFEVADADGYVFSNCKYEDLLVYTDVPSQAIHIGNTLNDMSAFMIRQNDVNVLRSMSIGKSNPNYPLDVLGNASIDGNLMSTKYIVSRGLQVKRRLAGFFSNPALPSGVVAGFSNDRDGVVISIDSNSSSNYIKFMASNTEVLYVNGQGLLTVSGSILPRSTQEYNIGAPTSRFNEAYMNALTLGAMRISGDINAITMPNTIISSTLTMSNWGQTTIYTSNAYLSIGKSNPTEALDILSNIKISSNAYVMSRMGIATSNPRVSLEVNSTDAVLLPRGTTGQRPGITTQGQIRYNTTLSTFEGYGAGSTWGSLGGVKDTNQDTYITSEVVTGSNDDTIRFYNSNIETVRVRLSNLEVNVPTTFYKTTSLLPTKMSPVYPYLPPAYNVTNSNFTISGQSYGNGAYTILGSSLFNNFTTYQAAFDQDISGRWMSAQTFKGPGSTYNSNQVTPAANGSNYPGEWLQITMPNTIVPTKLRMITGINNATYAVDTFTLLGSSNNGSTWKPFLSSIGNTGWPTSANSNLAFNYSIDESDIFNTFRVVFYKSYSDLIYVNYIAIDGSIPAPPIPPKLGVGLSNPSEDVDIMGNIRASSNAYVLNRIAIGHSNPTEALDVQGNMKINQQLYAMTTIAVGSSNATEAMDVQGNLIASSNIYANYRIGVATSNPQESLHAQGNIKASSNMYAAVCIGIATSNPQESLDAQGNIKASSNIYALVGIGIATSNPQEPLHVSGNAKVSSNLYVLAQTAFGHSNPKETLDIVGNIKGSSNLYIMSRMGLGTSNPSEAIDAATGNIKGSNIYSAYRIGVAMSNPTEALEVQGNTKINQNMYVLSNLGIGTSNPTVALEVSGNAKFSSNLEVMGNLTIRGITTTVDSTTVTVKDNVLRLNNGAPYSSSLQAGLEINRGSGSNDYLLVFDEPSNYFKVGQQGQLQTVATRDDNPASHSLMIYDNASKKLTACNSLTFSNSVLEVQGTMSTRPNAGNNAFQGLATGLTSGQSLHIALGQSNTPSNAALIKYTHNGLNNNTNNAQFGLWGFNHITCAGNGNVGINNASPSHAMDVTGWIRALGNVISTNTSSSGFSYFQCLSDFGNGLVLFQNGSTRSTDGGVNTATIRNDGGDLRLQATPANIGVIIRSTTGNVGVNTSSPSEALHVTGKILASTNQILGYTGDTALIPAYSWGDDSNTGIYHPAADTIAFTNNGSERMRIDSSGNVGIGVSSLSSKLTIGGETAQFPSSLLINETTHATSRRASINIGNWGLLQDINGNGTRNFSIYQGTAGGATATNALNILTNGNVGIGTTSPGVRLDVNGTLNATILQQNGNTLTSILSSYATTSSLSSYVTNTGFASHTHSLNSLDGTLSISKGGTGTATIPVFSAYRSANVSIANVTDTTIIFDTEDFDPNNAYNTGNGEFKPQTAGYYLCTWSVILQEGGASLIEYFSFLKKNDGNRYYQWGTNHAPSAAKYINSCGSCVVYMNGSSDALTVCAFQDSGGSLSVISNSYVKSRFTGVFVRSV